MIQALSDRISKQDQREMLSAHEFRSKALKYKSSKEWKIARKLQRVRELFFPASSIRTRLAKKLFSIILFPYALKRRQKVRLIKSSRLFDQDWYLKNYPDVFKAGLDPAEHYLDHGGFEDRNPDPSFSSRWYFETYPDIADAGMNPLLHYLLFGKKEGREIRESTKQRRKVGIVVVAHNASLAVRVTLAGLRYAKTI